MRLARTLIKLLGGYTAAEYEGMRRSKNAHRERHQRARRKIRKEMVPLQDLSFSYHRGFADGQAEACGICPVEGCLLAYHLGKADGSIGDS